MIACAVLVLCALTSLACTALLLRGYARSRSRLLLWSGIGFVGLAAQSVILFIDLVALPDLDLALYRNFAALIGLCILLFGLIWELG